MSKKSKPKYYVVWAGGEPGVYGTWTECQLQVKGYKGALFKSYDSLAEAEEAYAAGPPERKKVPGRAQKAPALSAPGAALVDESAGALAAQAQPSSAAGRGEPVVALRHLGLQALVVDAACSGNPGMMEYRGVYLGDGQEKFHYGPVWGTNNIGEFLAIVHGLSLLDKLGLQMPVYSDSRTALSWVRQKKCKTTLPRSPRTEALFGLIARAEQWLRSHDCRIPVRKWDTEAWGEIPADFGRKR